MLYNYIVCNNYLPIRIFESMKLAKKFASRYPDYNYIDLFDKKSGKLYKSYERENKKWSE